MYLMLINPGNASVISDCSCPAANYTGNKCYPGTYCPAGSVAPVDCTAGWYCDDHELATPKGKFKCSENCVSYSPFVPVYYTCTCSTV